MNIKKILISLLSHSPMQLWEEKILLASLLFSLPKHPKCPNPLRHNDRCLILANGPSAKEILPEILKRRNEFDLISVSWAQRVEAFDQLKPNMHVLTDPAFFESSVPADILEARKELSLTLRKVDWDLQLAVPYCNLSRAKYLYSTNSISVLGFPSHSGKMARNKQAQVLEKGYYSFGLQNVAATALYMALIAGYKKIYLAGMDADWLAYMRVDQNNKVYALDRHSYDLDGKIYVSDISYKQEVLCVAEYLSELEAAKDYAASINTEIINLSLLSLIDLFPKRDFSEL